MEGWEHTVQALRLHPNFPSSGSRILDVGAGAGDSAIPLASTGYHVTGLEISETAVQWAREKFLTLGLEGQFHTGSAADTWPFDDSSFDAVLDSACFHCITTKDRRATFLREAGRVLRRRGFLLISSMIGIPKSSNIEIDFDPISRCQLRQGLPYRFMSEEEALYREVESAGFTVIEGRRTENPWWDHLNLFALKS